MTKILITEFINQNSLENLNKKFDVKYDEKLCENKIEVEKIIKDYDGLIVRNKTQVNSDILKNASNLKFIGRLGVGLDNIDTEYCKNKNIYVQPATGMNADSVAEYVLSSSLSLIKKIPMFHGGTIKGEWPRTTIKSAEINQKCLGIIGFGTIGKKVAEYSLKNDLNVLAYDPYIKEINDKEINAKLSNLNEIFVDVEPDTCNIDIDLIEAYHENTVSGFALDVFENEPIKSEFYNKIKPDMNCILTPHISGVTTESNIRVSDFIVKKTIDFFN